ncbi:efflux RND transporter permease subunit [Alterisphingorhabdus coralli]|uniref:Efflux pump membrane transporter n=1 Tax=Alterisphingorhabdus coralli TaxID=3071408 RepID=A0AA97I098_9SPHN|nr:multidrug efflux RND transporter permease subunit [Parasphingorhabdus sp. SCSIO 66989]WOE74672.1 multidrug efflux RND transporter permease subunit [Parasphingorhabdus sp. SCSIO 66989]
MKFPHFFIERPIFAAVLSILIILVGSITYFNLPVAQYPEIAPPTITVTATYPGAGAEVVADTVATPIEQELNGVEDMLYMYSQSTDDGRLTITVTFALGTDLDAAQVLVQNRVSIAEPRLPEPVRRLGVITQKSSPDLLTVIHLNSPDESRDQLYISNYALLQIRDTLARLDGVGSITIFGAREYSMRIWLDPDKMAGLQITASDVVAALRAENVQVASGILGQPPVDMEAANQISVRTLGRLQEPEEFESIVVKTDERGNLTRVRDIARVELGAQDYSTNAYLDEKPAVAIAIFQRPGSNAIQTAKGIEETIEELSQDFPDGLAYNIIYNPTEFIAESVNEVYITIFEAVILVTIVVFIFLQSWRAAIIPIVAIPVSLIGTFAIMGALGFSLNNLSLFGLVLAIGIVVDDAIVVVENVERELRSGKSPKEAAHVTMDEVGGALIAIALVLSAVFVPTAFITGISGQFYQQFALTIATATIISAFNSLTLSPALAAILLQPEGHEEGKAKNRFAAILDRFFDWFNRSFDKLAENYGKITAKLIRMTGAILIVYALLIATTVWRFNETPTGFIPEQDQGYLIVAIQLPPGSSLSRTDTVLRRATDIILETPGFHNTAGFAGFSGATFTNAPNAGAIFAVMDEFDEREGAVELLAQLNQKLQAIDEAFIIVIAPPAVRGIGNAGGVRMMVQDRAGRGSGELNNATQSLIAAANQDPRLINVFASYETATPQLYLDIDRVKAQQLGVPISDVFSTLEVFLGSAFVNDFNYLGRTYRVSAQADAPYRMQREDISRLRARNADTGEMVPIGSVVNYRDITGPSRQPRYNLFPAAEIDASAAPGVSSGEAISAMEELAESTLPDGFSFEWTGLAYQEVSAGSTASLVFVFAVVIVFLVLAAQYESWLLPLAIILIVPMCLLSAIVGVGLRGIDNNILTQIGLVVLVGLASKNAILIVEFAKQREDGGLNRFAAAVEAAKLRLRPILMTSFAFILGVVPLMTASGAGFEMRQALGTAVFFGMLGVTIFGLFLTPAFYVLCRSLAARGGKSDADPKDKAEPDRPADSPAAEPAE